MEHVLVDRGSVRLRRPARLLRLASDERLVALVRAGEEGAFEALYDRHHPAILGFCRHMLGTREEAEDAVQHTFLAAFRDLAGSDKQIELRPWLFAIARNRCVSLLRSRRAHIAIELAEPATDGLAATVERREDVRELLADLASLPEDQRAALLLAELGALDHAGIATVLGCPRDKVKALVFQARSSLAASREARATPCDEIRLELATASGAALRRGPLRRHLRACDGCRAFKAEVVMQRKLLAVAFPVVPTVALKGSVLSGAFGGASASGGGAAGAASATAGAVSSTSGGTFGVLGTVASTGAGKVAVSLVVAGAVAGGGSALTERLAHHSVPPSSPATVAPGLLPTHTTQPPAMLGGAPVRGAASPTDRRPGRHDPSAPGSADTSGGTLTPHVPAADHAPHASPSPSAPHVPADPPRSHEPAHQTPPAQSGGGPGGQGTAPPSQQGAPPPGHGTTPPGQQGAPPPARGTTPPGQQGATPSGREGTPPSGHAQGNGPSDTPPSRGETPPAQSKAPAPEPPRAAPDASADSSPSANAGSPQAPPSAPPGQSGASHGNSRH